MSATDVILSDASEGIYVYQTSFRISYTNREPVPVQEVIKSLQALQGILPKVPDLIEGWLDVKISHGEFFIESLETGSLIEDILMKLYFANQEELDAFMAKIRSNPMLRNSLAGLALGVLVTWGAMTALGSKTPANQVKERLSAGKRRLRQTHCVTACQAPGSGRESRRKSTNRHKPSCSS